MSAVPHDHAESSASSRAARPLRVAVLSELPTPYRWPLFERVAARPEIDLTVLFYSRTESDRDWGRLVEERTGDDAPHVEFLPGKAYKVRGHRTLFFHWNPGIAKRLEDGHFDVVVIPGWSMPTSLAAIRHCKRRGVPYVVFSETQGLAPKPWASRTIKRIALPRLVGKASAWLSTGTESQRFLVRHGASQKRVFRFANTPDVPTLQAAVDAARPQRAATRARLGIPEGATVALFVGRLIPAKDPLTLLAAQEQLEGGPDAPWLLIVGDGPEGESMRQRVRERGLRHVVLTGALKPDELPPIWAAADLFVLPSLHEAWGVVVNEAMAARLPVVLSDRVGAAADLLVEGHNGRVVPVSDAAALAAAIREIHADPELCRRMSQESARIIAGWGYGPSVQGFVDAVQTAAGGAT